MSRFRRVLVIVAVCSAFVVMPLQAAQAKSFYMSSVVYQHQAKSLWCWASCGSMVIRTLGGTQSQSDVVAYTYPGLNLPNFTASMAKTNAAVEHFRPARDGAVVSTTVSYANVVKQIDNGDPIIAGWVLDAGSKHMVVIRGYDDAGSKYLYYVDPADGYHKVPYSWFVDGADHRWIESTTY
jgi:hypothetical protein